MGLTHRLAYLLQHSATTMYQQSDQMLQERLGIGMSQFRLLKTLQDAPNVQQRTLAACLGQTEASISRQTKLLVDKGMLQIRVNPKNRREHIMLPTAKGIKLTQAALEVLDEYYAPAFTQLNERQQRQLEEMLSVLHDYCCQPGKPHACDRTYML